MTSPRLLIGIGLAGVAAAFAAAFWFDQNPPDGAPKATPELLAQGRQVYAEYCASCHGANLEGQGNWREKLPSGRLPAPPHDETGHTWHHPDQVLFALTKQGPAVLVGNGYQSDMPGFGEVLTDQEIWSVLAYIKSRWPERERAYQEQITRQSQ